MADTETETTAVPDKTMTEYVVLMWISEPGDREGYWVHQSTIDARSAENAIRQYGAEGRFIAIPKRSWKPITVTARQTTTLNLKPAT